MSDQPLSIATMGGVPASLGGGGLERQRRLTGEALRRRGHTVIDVEVEPGVRTFDVLHAFGAEPDVCHFVAHWRRPATPLVVSPVLVVPPAREWRELLAARVPLASFGPRARAGLLRRADLVVAQTRHEERLVRRLGARHASVVPNAVEPIAPTRLPTGLPPHEYLLVLGTVSARKRQVEIVEQLGDLPLVVAGGFQGTSAERARWDAATSVAVGTTWLGEVEDAGTVRALLAGARGLVHLSAAEGQSLAVLEAISVGTPVLVSPLPAHRELAEQYPALVHVVDGPGQVRAVVDQLHPADPGAVLDWDDVAVRLEQLYRGLLAAA